MIYLPLIAVACVTLVARIVVELAIVNQLLPKDRDQDRASRYVIIANGVLHPIFVLAVGATLVHELWTAFLLTPLIELVGAAAKAALFARVGMKRDPLLAIITACFASALSLVAAGVVGWVVLHVVPVLSSAL